MQLIDLDTLEQIKSKAAAVPEKPKIQFTKTQALSYLKDEIASLLGKNYTPTDIREFLKEQGLSISLTTLKAFLKTAFPKEGGRKKNKKTIVKDED